MGLSARKYELTELPVSDNTSDSHKLLRAPI